MAEFKDWSAEDQDSWQQRYKQGKYAETPQASPSPTAPIAASPEVQAQPPGVTAAPAASDYPSLPPGATPPPGYHDPISGKTAPVAGAATPAPATPVAATPAAPATPGAAATTPGQPTTIADAFKASLVNTLNQGNVTPTLNDPTLKAQSDAYNVGETRATEANRAQMAERAAMQGGTGVNSGAFDVGISDLLERQGERQGGFNAKLVGDEAKQRKQQLLQAAAIAGQHLSAEEARKLQMELAQLDATISREGIASQANIAGNSLGVQSRIGEGGLNNQLLSILLGNQYNNAALQQQGTQFTTGLDTQTILSLLGGL
jgi:hypothetical protein